MRIGTRCAIYGTAGEGRRRGERDGRGPACGCHIGSRRRRAITLHRWRNRDRIGDGDETAERSTSQLLGRTPYGSRYGAGMGRAWNSWIGVGTEGTGVLGELNYR